MPFGGSVEVHSGGAGRWFYCGQWSRSKAGNLLIVVGSGSEGCEREKVATMMVSLWVCDGAWEARLSV